jgi:hypothetical protein
MVTFTRAAGGRAWVKLMTRLAGLGVVLDQLRGVGDSLKNERVR